MKNAIKKAISILLVAVMVFGTAPLAGFVGLELPELNLFSTKADAAPPSYPTSGTCGLGLRWSLNTTTGELVISGTGDMTDWKDAYATPWNNLSFYIETLIIKEGVTSIGNYAFGAKGLYDYYTFLKTIKIPASVKNIGEYSFEGCKKLETTYYVGSAEQWTDISMGTNNDPLNENVIICECNSAEPYIGGSCGEDLAWKYFSDTGALEITGIGAMVDREFDYYRVPWYDYRESIKTVTMSEGMTSIGNHAFRECVNLKNVTIPESVTRIGEYAFYECRGMTKVNIPSGVTEINERSFYNCNSLTGVKFSQNLQTIGEAAFMFCKALKSITIPDSVTNVKDGAFDHCENVEYITLGKNLKIIGEHAFGDCRGVKTLTIPASVEVMDYGFFGLMYLETLKISSGVTTIGTQAFNCCFSLKEVYIPKTVKTIKAGAFAQSDKIKDEINTVYYEGSVSDWQMMSIDVNNDKLLLANKRFNQKMKEENPDTPSNPNIPEYDYSDVDTFLVATPSKTTISYGDSIYIHVDPSKIPEGGRVEWYQSNDNFSHAVSGDGKSYEIRPNKSGKTTITAIVYDANGNIVSVDTQEMTSKAGFFDKIIGFFKSLFGLTKTYSQAFKGIY